MQLCFNIFPRIKTVLHKFVEESVDVGQLRLLMDKANMQKLPDGTSVTVPILADIDNNTALDIALAPKTFSINLANYLLVGI